MNDFFVTCDSFCLKSLLSNVSIAIPALCDSYLHGILFFYPFAFSLCVSLKVKSVPHRQHEAGSCFLVHFTIFMPFVW